MRMNCYKIKIYCFRKAVIMPHPFSSPPHCSSPLQACTCLCFALVPFIHFEICRSGNWYRRNLPLSPQSLMFCSPPSQNPSTAPTPNKTQIHPFIFMPNKKQKFYAISWSSTVVFLTILLACGHQRLLDSVQVDSLAASPPSFPPFLLAT